MQLNRGSLTLALREASTPSQLGALLLPSQSPLPPTLGEPSNVLNAIHLTAASSRLSSLLSKASAATTPSSDNLHASCQILHLIKSNISLLDTRGLSNTIWSVGKIHSSQTNAKLRKTCVDLMNELLLLVVQVDASDLTPQHISNIMWACGVVFNSREISVLPEIIPSLVARLLECSNDRLPDFTAQGLANVLWSCASLKEVPSREWMEAFYRHSLAVSPSLIWDHRSISICLWSLAKLLLTPPPHWFKAIIEAQLSASKLSGFDAQSLCNTAWALSEFDLKPESAWVDALCKVALEVIIDSSNDRMDHSRMMQVSTMLSALLKFRPSPNYDLFVFRASEFFISAPQTLEVRTFSSTSWALAKLDYTPSKEWLSSWIVQVDRLGLEADSQGPGAQGPGAQGPGASHSISCCLWAWSKWTSLALNADDNHKLDASSWWGPSSWASRTIQELSRRASEDSFSRGQEKESVLLLLGSLVAAKGTLRHDLHFISLVDTVSQVTCSHMESHDYSKGQLISGLWSLASLGVKSSPNGWIEKKVHTLGLAHLPCLLLSDSELALRRWLLKEWGVVDVLSTELEELGPRELAASICLASKSAPLPSYFTMLADRLSSQAQLMNPTDLSMSLHACAVLGYRHGEAWRKAVWSAFATSAPRFTASELALGLWAISSLRMKPILRHQKIIVAVIEQLEDNFVAIDTARLLHAASSLKMKPHRCWDNLLLRALSSLAESSTCMDMLQEDQKHSLITILLNAGRLGLSPPADKLDLAFAMLRKFVEKSACSPHDLTSIMESSILLAKGNAHTSEAQTLFRACVNHMSGVPGEGRDIPLRSFTLTEDAHLLRCLWLQKNLCPSWMDLAEIDGLLTTFFILSQKRIKPGVKASSSAALSSLPSPSRGGIESDMSRGISRPSFPPQNDSPPPPPPVIIDPLLSPREPPSPVNQILHCLYWSSKMKRRADVAWIKSCTQCLGSQLDAMTCRELCDSLPFIVDAGHRPSPSWVGSLMGRIIIKLEKGEIGQGQVMLVTRALSKLDSKLFLQWKKRLVVSYSSN